MRLMSHQVAGVKFATARKGSLLSGQPGSGKTAIAVVSSLTWLVANPTWNRVIICVPASLKENWRREWESWAASMPVLPTQKLKIGVVAGGGEWPEDCQVIIISYDLVYSDEYTDQIYSEPWDILIVDESHFIKSPKAKRTKAIASIKARRKMLLSGTPAPNRPCELFPQLNILNPKVWDSWYKYIQRYCDAKKGYNNSWDYSGASNTKELYERLTQGPDAIMFRVLKKDCLDLKEKQHKIIEVPPPEECNTLLDREKMLFKMRDTTLDNLRRIREEAQYGDEENYKENASNLNSTQTAAMSEMARIRRELAVAKAPLVVDHARSLLDSGTNKLVVAGHHREALSIVADQLQSYGAMLYMGGVGLLKRQEMVDKFQQDPAARVMVLGIMAGGVGITLTASSHIIMSESTWNTATNTQAIDRLDRMSQTEQVKIDWLVFKGSLDAMVLKKCLSKDKVVDAIIDGVESKDTPQESKPQKIKTDYKALGLKMSDAQKQAALDALRHIALLDSDGAKKANGLGFNRFHSQIGRELASRVALTPAQAALAREIATKYKTQLTPSLRIALQS